ncbi:TPA: hypothetical protein GFX97_18210 [Escherichia coli]|nr:hypothetical protein [Escherichia coli]
MKHLTEMVRQHKAGKTNGIYAVCSAHPLVLEAAIRYASANQTPLLIEATSNQVDQFGGYTGMTPADFRGFVCQLADSLNFPQDALILGGDHLGPNRWQNLPAAQAMANADDLIKSYVAAGFKKIHLDCSMSCQDDPIPLTDDIVAERAARLAKVADRCQAILTSLGDFSEGVFGYAPWKRIVYLGSGGLQGAARESALKVLELTAGKLAAFYDSPTGFRHGPKSLVDDETLVVVFVSSHPYTRQYDLDLLAELRRDNQAMRVIAIAAESTDIVAAGPHIILPPSRHFIDVEQAFCFLMYAQTFALMQSLHMGNTPDTPSASGTVNRVVQGVIIHPWQA